MESTIVKIGNSKGIRIPSPVLNQLNLDVKDTINLEVKDEKLVISKKIKKNTPRIGWNEAFKEMHKNGDDKLIEMPELENDVYKLEE
jgi:antitoxin MazE